MNNLSSSEIKNILSQIETLRLLIDESAVEATSYKLNQFENKLTLAEIEYCLSIKDKGDISERLCAVLARRWGRIRATSMSYTENPLNIVNQFCLDLARILYPLPKTEKEIDELPAAQGPYFILMPSLIASTDVVGSNIHNLSLQQFILADGEELFIPILPILDRASRSDNGDFEHYVSLGLDFPKLSEEEFRRLKYHSTIVEEYVFVIERLNKFRIKGHSFGANLQRLVNALRSGGSHGGNGQEFNAGSQANIGILEFSRYWDGLAVATRSDYLRSYPELNDVLGRLFRPTDRDYRDVTFCVELIAEAIDTIITSNHLSTNSLEKFERSVANSREIVEREIKSEAYNRIPTNINLPKIYSDIYKLPFEKQQLIFLGYENVWMYLLANDPESLVEIKDLVSEEIQEKTRHLRLAENKTPLMIAAAAGCNQAVNILLEMHVNIDEVDIYGETALMYALRANKTDVVEALLAKNLKLTLRNNNQNNVLDIAIANHPECIDEILLQAVNLSLADQTNLLSKIDGGRHKTVLSYAVFYKPNLVDEILTKTIDLKKKDVLSTKIDLFGMDLFLLPSLVLRLIDEGMIDINKQDNYGRTILHIALYNNAELAIALLSRDVDLSQRENVEFNALSIARFSGNQKLIHALLLKASSLDKKEQNELLSKLPINIDSKQDVLAYARNYCNHDFQKKLLMKILDDNNMDIIEEKYQINKSDLLILAVELDDNELVKRLIDEFNVDPNNNLYGLTAISLAITKNKTDIIDTLLSKEINLDAALHDAINRKDQDTVDLLLAKGAKITAVNSYGQNALDLALGNSFCVDTILVAGSRLEPSMQKKLLSKCGTFNDVISYVLSNKPYLLMPVFKQIQPDNVKLEAYIKQIDLLRHIKVVKAKWQEMVVKARENPKYIKAARVAGELISDLINETSILLQSDSNLEVNDKKIAKFKSKCLSHIDKAKPILEEHRGDLWKIILGTLIVALTFPISLTLFTLGFFSIKTDSAIKLNHFENDLITVMTV